MIGGFLAAYYVPRGLGLPLVRETGTNEGGIIGTGRPRCDDNGVVIYAPTQVNVRISGLYQSVLPDAQVSTVEWDDGTMTKDYFTGAGPGLCDTILSANLLEMGDTEYVDWDLHDLSEDNNDIGHGEGQDQLGMNHCTSRIYSLFIKNRSDSEANMVVGASATNEWTSLFDTGATITLPPDSIFAVIGEHQAGMAVTSTNCNLRVEANGIAGGSLLYGLNWCGSSL